MEDCQNNKESFRFGLLYGMYWGLVFCLSSFHFEDLKKSDLKREKEGIVKIESAPEFDEQRPLLGLSETGKHQEYGDFESQKTCHSQFSAPRLVYDAVCSLTRMIYAAWFLSITMRTRADIGENNWTEGVLIALLCLGSWEIIRLFKVMKFAVMDLRASERFVRV